MEPLLAFPCEPPLYNVARLFFAAGPAHLTAEQLPHLNFGDKRKGKETEDWCRKMRGIIDQVKGNTGEGRAGGTPEPETDEGCFLMPPGPQVALPDH